MIFPSASCWRIWFVLVSICMLQLPATSQSTTAAKTIIMPPSVKHLNVGDILPNVTLTNIHNYPASRISLAGFQKGRYMILDFWSTWCAACISAFPKMHKFKDQFKDSLQILLVNAKTSLDTEAKVADMILKRKERTGMDVTLPYVVEETTLSPYFRYKFIPHYVWVNPDGSIYAVTGADEATQENVAAFIRGKKPVLHIKEDAFNYDTSIPLFVNNNGGNGNEFAYRAILTQYKEGLGSTMGRQIDSASGSVRTYLLNQSLGTLYSHADGEQNITFNNRYVFAGDSKSFEDKFLHTERLTNRYCYELILPISSGDETNSYLQQDLERIFKVKARKELRTIKCIAITSVLNAKKFATTHLHPLLQTSEDGEEKKMFNVDFDTFLAVLNTISQTPIISDISINGKIDFTIPANITSTTELVSYLNSKGVITQQAERELPITVFERTQPVSKH